MPPAEPDRHPHIVWELTRACSLGCTHCPSGAQRRRSVLELSTYEGYRTIDQIATLQPRTFAITGGDPFERPDTLQFIEYARRRGLDPVLNVSPTPAATPQALALAHRAGLTHIAIAIDSPEPRDSAAIPVIRAARAHQLAVEVNTLVSRRTIGELAFMPELLNELDVAAWNLYFLVPSGHANEIGLPPVEGIEEAFDIIYDAATAWGLRVHVMEAPQYRRYLVQKGVTPHGIEERIFISHSGEVAPSEFLPLAGGNLLFQPLGIIYRSSDFFVALRDSDNLKGKCGRCEYRGICGGSRARAFAVTGDAFAADPLCPYQEAPDA